MLAHFHHDGNILEPELGCRKVIVRVLRECIVQIVNKV